MTTLTFRLRRAVRRLTATLPWLLFAAAAPAQEIPGYSKDVYGADPRDMALIPSYCPYTLLFRDKTQGDGKQAMFDAWNEKVGGGFIHMHHYCAGLINANRALLLAKDGQTRQYLLNNAITEYDYVIPRVPATNVLMPEFLTRKGEAYVHLDKGAIGAFYFEQAIELKPDYWPAYGHLADHHRKAGNTAKAREVLEAGLAKAPGTPALMRRLEALGGKP